MCGIAGYFDINLDQRDLIQRTNVMSKELDHRGPDSHGEWSDQNLSISIGHRRLSILDLTETGHQPMISSSGRYVISYNGEIYNHRQLRTDLEKRGHRFETHHSDTEVLLHGYREWGFDLTSRLNGMWAFAIWDSVEQTLFLSRDRFGVNPLFFLIDDEQFNFSVIEIADQLCQILMC